jgi:hypothetical protein
LNILNTEFEPVVKYLNGVPQGIMTLTDRVNRRYISELYDIDKDKILFVSDSSAAPENQSQFSKLIPEILALDLEDYGNEDWNSTINVSNFHDYIIANTYSINVDWPWKNIKLFRSEEYDNNRINFILSDMDFSMGYQTESHHNNLDFLGNEYKLSVIFTHLFKSEGFRNDFINRYCDLLATELRPGKATAILDSLVNLYEPHIDWHRSIWPESAQNWTEGTQATKEFTENRNYWIYEHLMGEFDLPGRSYVRLSSSHPGNSQIRFSGLTHRQFPWAAEYMQGVPITLEAIPSEGYRFVRWEQDYISGGASTEIILDKAATDITAIFERIKTTEPIDRSPVISEIMYAAPQDNDTGDWIEIYNPSNLAIDVSGWSITDDREKEPMVFPQGTEISGYGFLILADNEESFTEQYSITEKMILLPDIPFGLSRNGDQILLMNSEGELVDSLIYEVGTSDWPDANRNGRSIVLINWSSDNTLGVNWERSTIEMGSPGDAIYSYVPKEEQDDFFGHRSIQISKSEGELDLSKFTDNPNIIEYAFVQLIGRVIFSEKGSTIDLTKLNPAIYLTRIEVEVEQGYGFEYIMLNVTE